ncbi:SRPBCC family protein [Mycolicibacterium hodleri]|uniref:SRPBCC family protein n=1 Tax=Mycolicibacterium hodleri TaxID=49897 RepID=A0A502EH99_9MYCO|nr:SRPBCC family protein [Mycolicibacterium hodleri]TPG35880.1 SRPBCC family protein [Mycolicibacterium hodleri]
MTQPMVVEQSRAIPVTQDAAFDGTVPIPLPTLFHRWYGPIPPIKTVEGQTGDWDEVGKSRTVFLRGGGSMREVLTSYDVPRSFGYTLSDVKGPLAPLVEHIEGLWAFEPVGTGTKVTWRWTIHPRSALVAPALPVFGKLWLGYARQSLEELSNQLVG